MRLMNNIFLIGPMGAGKSTIGKLLAQNLGLGFTDSDKEIESRTGASIPLIFEIEGEQGFRDREAAIIDELTADSNLVLATGGGAILRAENRDALKNRGTVIYLHTTVAQQAERTAFDTQRPLLQTGDRTAKLATLMEEREPLYRDCADIVIETQGRTPRSVVELICQKLPIPRNRTGNPH